MNLIHTRCLNRKSNETHLNTVTSFWTHRVIKLFGSFMDLELESSPSPPPDEGLRLALAPSLVPPAEASTETNPVGNTDALPVSCLFTSGPTVAPLPPPPEAIIQARLGDSSFEIHRKYRALTYSLCAVLKTILKYLLRNDTFSNNK